MSCDHLKQQIEDMKTEQIENQKRLMLFLDKVIESKVNNLRKSKQLLKRS